MATSAPSGVSYHRIASPALAIRRSVLKLQAPLKIESEREGNDLFKWLAGCPFPFIHKMQLRKVREAPFFHEYIVFSLHDDNGYFRIDRRPQSGRNILDCIHEDRVEAEDTIEQVTSFDDGLYCSSDCLIEIEFEHFDTSLGSLLQVCWAIREHPHAKMYTVQRYNCYFFAQTIVICMARMKIGSFSPIAQPEEGPPAYCPLETEFSPNIIRVRNKRPDYATPGSGSRWKAYLAGRGSVLEDTTLESMEDYIDQLVLEHSERVQQFKQLLKCSAEEVKGPVSSAREEIWGRVVQSTLLGCSFTQPNSNGNLSEPGLLPGLAAVYQRHVSKFNFAGFWS